MHSGEATGEGGNVAPAKLRASTGSEWRISPLEAFTSVVNRRPPIMRRLAALQSDSPNDSSNLI